MLKSGSGLSQEDGGLSGSLAGHIYFGTAALLDIKDGVDLQSVLEQWHLSRFCGLPHLSRTRHFDWTASEAGCGD